MKTKITKVTSLLVVLVAMMSFNEVKAQDKYAYTIFSCHNDNGTMYIFASNVFNIQTAKDKFGMEAHGETVDLFQKRIESKGIDGLGPGCYNNIKGYNKGPDGDDLQGYLYNIIHRSYSGIDYTEASDRRSAAISKITKENEGRYSIKVIDIKIF